MARIKGLHGSWRFVGTLALVLVVGALVQVRTHTVRAQTHVSQAPGPLGVGGPAGGPGSGSGGGAVGAKGQRGMRTGAGPSVAGPGPGVAPAVSAAAAPTNTWVHLAPATNPTVRFGASMSTDSARNTVVLFGGRNNNGTPLKDTWVWDGTNWTLKTPAHMPPARYGARMAFDIITRDVLLFGGSTCTTFNCGTGGLLGDTWLWNGSDWLQPSPATSPSPRTGAVLAATKGVVLFGGNVRGSGACFNGPVSTTPVPMCAVNDTWLWNGTTWTQVMTSGPTPRTSGQLASDASGRTVLVGGLLRGGGFVGQGSDTWAFGPGQPPGGGWSPLSLTTLPFERSAGGFAATNFPSPGLLLFAGRELDFEEANDTWFLGSGPSGGWSQQTPALSPPRRELYPAMATDPTTGRPLVLVEQNTNPPQTWRWGN